MNKVLIVEDEKNIRSFLKINLQRNNFSIFEAESGEAALDIITNTNIDIVLLDVMLPGIDGFEVCRRIRKKKADIGIIMLTAKGQDMDKIMGLEYGADDYIVKPFNPMELMLRIKAILRRINNCNDKKEIQVGKFKIDTYSKIVMKENKILDLTPKEYLLMKLFLENPMKAFERDILLDLIWGEDYFGDSKIIDVNVRRLRAKIEDNPSEPNYIETVWGVGYRWKV